MTWTPTCSTAPSDPFSHPNGCLRSYGRFRVVGSAPSGRARRRVRGGTLQRRGCPEREVARAENAAGLAGCRARLLSRRGDGEFRHFSPDASATVETVNHSPQTRRGRLGVRDVGAGRLRRRRVHLCDHGGRGARRLSRNEARRRTHATRSRPRLFALFADEACAVSFGSVHLSPNAAPRLTRTRDPFVSSRTLPCAGAHGASPRRGAPEVLPQRQASRLALPAVGG